MAIEGYAGQIEPQDQDAVILRFLNMKKFRNLMDTWELYFCRADLFHDENEGLPPENYRPFPELNPLDLRDRQQINDSIGFVAQSRESFYLNCWHLFREETWKMWKEYGEDGVAVSSRYRLLKSALDAMDDRTFLGLVRYGSEHMTGWNLFRFITTKRIEYADEQEVRAGLWIIDPCAGGNRHFDSDNRAHTRPLTSPPATVLEGHRRRVDLQALVTEIVVTPWATSTTFEQINQLVKNSGYDIPVQPSALARYRELLPHP
jgi:hypothetical protein